jgi:outer membrane protein assembly factor BamA
VCNKSILSGFWSLVLASSLVGVCFAALSVSSLAADECDTGNGRADSKLVVRSIRIEVREIFDEPNLGLGYRTVNSVKMSTREEIVRRELLLKEGDLFDEFLVQESERNLRALPFLRQVSIVPVRDCDSVDLIVSVQDTWTLYPFMTLNSGTGSDKKAVGIAESNLFGYGKRIEFLVADDEGRQKIESVWEDNRLFGTYNQLTLGHFQRSDGYHSVASLGRPFRSFVDPYAWSANFDSFDLVGRLFKAGETRYIYRQRHNAFTTGYTWSKGDPETLINRYTLGYDYTRDDFKQGTKDDFDDINLTPFTASTDPELLAENREFSGPFLSYERVEPNYISINFIDRFERVEDFNLGNDFSISSHIAPRSLGSLEDTLLMKFYDSDGWRPTPTSFLRGEISGSSRVDDGGVSNTLAGVQLKYFNVLGASYLSGFYIGKHTLASAFSADYGDRLDKDFELLLGATSGLRGYSDRTFTGNQRMVLNVEDRFHIVEDVFRLVSLGGAFFVDGGGTSQNGFGEILTEDLYGDIGFGLRIGLTRSSGGAVVRIDVAFPLRNGPDGSAEFEPRILFSTGQLFNGNLRSESESSQAARVSAGFLP